MKKNAEAGSFKELNKLILTMKLLFALMLTSFVAVSANSYSQVSKLSINMKTATVMEIFEAIEQQSEFIFFYQDQNIDLNRRVSIDVEDKNIDEVLNLLLENTGNTYRINDRQVIIGFDETKLEPQQENSESIKEETEQPQKKTITGKVTDSKGEPLPGVSIIVKGTTVGITTDFDGNYSLEIPEDAEVLVFSFVGMKSQEVNLIGDTQINVVLLEDSTELDELIVVGYGTQKKANLTGAVDQISAESLKNTPVGSIGEVLQGQLPNVNIGIADGKPGRNASFNIRGLTSINGGSPLILIDGVPGGDINTIPPQDIESVSVLKDAASAAIYGGKATFGVILVTTKQAKRGVFSVDYSNSFSYSKPIIVPDVYTGNDYMEIQEEFSANINQTYFTPQQIDYARQVAIDPSLPHAKYENGQLYVGGEFHNYYKEWFRDFSPKQQHHLSISSGGEKLNLYSSVDYSRTEGPLKLSPTVINGRV